MNSTPPSDRGLSPEYQAAVKLGAISEDEARLEQFGDTSLPRRAAHRATFSHADLMRETFEPVQWGIQGLCPQGVVLLAAKPKIGKSWLVLQMCYAKASGSPLWKGRESEDRGEALYLALEDNKRRLFKRARLSFPTELSPDPGPVFSQQSLNGLHFATEWPRMGDGGIEGLDIWLGDHPDCHFVGIDTVAKFRKPKSGRDDYGDDYELGSRLKDLADRHNVSIVLVHHTRKQAVEDPFDAVSGTQGLSGSADATLILTRERGQGNAGLFITGRDIEEETELALSFDSKSCRWESLNKSVSELALDESRQRVLDVLKRIKHPATIKEIKAELAEDGHQPKLDTLRKTVQRMVQKNQLQLVDGNKYEVSHVSQWA